MGIMCYILICGIGILSGRVQKILPSLRLVILAAASSLSCLQTILTYAITYDHPSDALALFLFWFISNFFGYKMSKVPAREE